MPPSRSPDRDPSADVALRRALCLAADTPAAGPCLGDGDLAALLDGSPECGRERAVAHLAACRSCRHRLAGASRLLQAEDVAAERRRLDVAPRRPGWRSVAGTIGVAASLAAAFLLGGRLGPGPGSAPGGNGGPESAHREGLITSTVAPRVLPFPGPAGTPDSLRWTSVPYADRYQVLVFDREGTLVWEPQTRDTVLALPGTLAGAPGTYIWKVEARTGWDRWVASEWARFTLDSRGGEQ